MSCHPAIFSAYTAKQAVFGIGCGRKKRVCPAVPPPLTYVQLAVFLVLTSELRHGDQRVCHAVPPFSASVGGPGSTYRTWCRVFFFEREHARQREHTHDRENTFRPQTSSGVYFLFSAQLPTSRLLLPSVCFALSPCLLACSLANALLAGFLVCCLACWLASSLAIPRYVGLLAIPRCVSLLATPRGL